MIERVKSAMVGLGAGWVLILMLVLSVVSLAIMLERAWLYWSLRDDGGLCAGTLICCAESGIGLGSTGGGNGGAPFRRPSASTSSCELETALAIGVASGS